MKRYTLKKLPPSTQESTEDIRLSFAKSRKQYLQDAFKDLFLNETLIMRVILIILTIGAIGMLAAGRPMKAIIYFTAILIYYGKFYWTINKVYSLQKENNFFPILTSEGPQNIMSINNEERYIRVESPSWEEVIRISFYSDFLVIEMNKKSEYGLMYMWSENMEETKQTVLNMWRNALNSKEHNTATLELYSETEFEEISDFIEKRFGKYETVIHEITSTDIHVDIAVIPPTKEQPFYTLCTIGVGAHRMNVPDAYRYECQIAERAELLIYLPADWNLTEEGWSDERNYWPIRLLKELARMPINTDSWMAWGHSFSQEEVEPFAEDTPYSSAVLLSPQPDINNNVSCPLTIGKTIDFFQVFPLTHDELAYKIKCADDEANEDSPTDRLLDYMHADRDKWIDYALSRFEYRR